MIDLDPMDAAVPTLESRTRKMLDQCLIRMQALGYGQHSLNYFLSRENAVNAVARSLRDDVVEHEIDLFEPLLLRLDQIARAFAASGPDGMRNDMQNTFRLITAKHLRGDTAQLLYMFSVCFVFFHEVGHLNQQHRKLRNSLGYQIFEDEYHEMHSGAELCTGEEALLRQTLELAADHEGIRRLLDMVLALAGPPETPQDDPTHLLWAAVTAVTLVFHVFQGSRDIVDPLPPMGRHPQPSARMLALLGIVADFFDAHPQSFPQAGEARLHASIEGAVIAASQFWARWFPHNPAGELPRLHAALQQPGFFVPWDREIARVWNSVVPQINAQRICKGVKLPLKP